MRLSHNNEAASQKLGYLTTIRLPHNNETASKQYGCLTTIKLPHNCGFLTTVSKLTILGLPLNNKLITTMRAVARLARNCRSDFQANLEVAAAKKIREAFN